MFRKSEISNESNSKNESSSNPMSVSASLPEPEPESKSTPVSEAERVYSELKQRIKQEEIELNRKFKGKNQQAIPADKSKFAIENASFKKLTKPNLPPRLEEQKGSEKTQHALNNATQQVLSVYKQLAKDFETQDIPLSDLIAILRAIPYACWQYRNEIATTHANKITNFTELYEILHFIHPDHQFAFVKLHLDKIKSFPHLLDIARALPKQDQLEFFKLYSNLIKSFKELNEALLHLSSKNRSRLVELHKDKFTTFIEVEEAASRLSPKISKQFFETHLDKVKKPEDYTRLFDYYLSSIELNEFFSTHEVKMTFTTTNKLIRLLIFLLTQDLSRNHFIQFVKQHLAVVTTFHHLERLLRYIPQDLKSEIVAAIAPQLRPETDRLYQCDEQFFFIDSTEIGKLPLNDRLFLIDTFVNNNGFDGLMTMLEIHKDQTDRLKFLKKHHLQFTTLDHIISAFEQLFDRGQRLNFTSFMLDKIESLNPSRQHLLFFIESLRVTKLSDEEPLNMTSFKTWLQTQIKTYSTIMSMRGNYPTLSAESKSHNARVTAQTLSPFVRSITSSLNLTTVTTSTVATPANSDQNVSTPLASPSKQ
ncbi:MAG: hypothetical protein ABI597_12610 [Gammaproteobacteria bacterium]